MEIKLDKEMVKKYEEEGMLAFRHTASHILAHAMKRLYPSIKLAIGPATKDGFYYDFESEQPITSGDLDTIEKEMIKIVKEKHEVNQFYLSREEAISLMKERKEDYKIELINDLEENEKISFYQQGEFIDLCKGPHISNTKDIKAIKLLSVAGAYWKGDEKNKVLTRIYGVAFKKEKELKEYLERVEEAKKRDHRKLGKELGLFTLMEEGPGFPFFLPKGMVLKNLLLKYWRELHERENYVEISTPMMLTQELWETSGHWEHYRENMYVSSIDDKTYAIKPMNCPGGVLAYRHSSHSYKEFPIRMGELGLVHRHEKSGALHGLMRVRCFTQDDAHIFMRKSQVVNEIKGVMVLIHEVYTKFDFNYHIELSTRPENSIGSDDDWNMAIDALSNSLKELDLPYSINEGDGAFYGPKIDFHLEDSLGRTWQCGTIQLDFQLPQRFQLEYVEEDGKLYPPVMIHRVVYGSIERFIGILIEHYGAKFPTWLAPVQCKVLLVSDKQKSYGEQVEKQLKNGKVRVELDERDEKLGLKIREAQLEKVPYMIIIGEKEQLDGMVSVRSRDKGELGSMSLLDFISHVQGESTLL